LLLRRTIQTAKQRVKPQISTIVTLLRRGAKVRGQNFAAALRRWRFSPDAFSDSYVKTIPTKNDFNDFPFNLAIVQFRRLSVYDNAQRISLDSKPNSNKADFADDCLGNFPFAN
jgi:hypothetical protein